MGSSGMPGWIAAQAVDVTAQDRRSAGVFDTLRARYTAAYLLVSLHNGWRGVTLGRVFAKTLAQALGEQRCSGCAHNKSLPGNGALPARLQRLNGAVNGVADPSGDQITARPGRRRSEQPLLRPPPLDPGAQSLLGCPCQLGY